MKKMFLGTAALLLALLNLPLTTAHAQGTAFTYQGRLINGTNPVTGSYDLRFAVYDALSSGTQQGVTLTNTATAVTNGLFTVTLDFGAQVFNGSARWLDIAVRTNGNGTFTGLTPRTAFTATPYASYAGNAYTAGYAFVTSPSGIQAGTANISISGNAATAGTATNLSGTLASANLSGTYSSVVTLNNGNNAFSGSFSGNGAGLTNVNAATVGGQPVTNLWQLGGNNVTAGQFLGSTNNQPVEFWVNGNRALRLEVEYDYSYGGYTPNIIGGYAGNVVTNGYGGCFIGAGGNVEFPNRVGGWYASVLGGIGNTASSDYSTAMGYETAASGNTSTAMGLETAASGIASTALGQSTIASGQASTALGFNTTASGNFSTALGYQTKASGNTSTALGFVTAASGNFTTALGFNARATNDYTFVWADGTDYPQPFTSTAPNQFLVLATGGVGINVNNPAYALDVGGRLRLRQTTGGTAGLWLYQTGPASDQAFVGMDLDGYVGFYGNMGANWGLVMNVTNGFVGIGNQTPSHLLQVGTAYCDGSAWYPSSDRNLKAGFAAVDAAEILAKVTTLPITRWHYKNDVSTAHVGPMAQDFHAAFATGPDDKHIADVDEGGVALAAIQGLNEKLEAENAALKARLDRLERLLTEKTGGAK